LANVLFEIHGLTLQQNKTHILPVADFIERYLETGSKKEKTSLTQRFREILEDIGIEDPYEEIDYDELDSEIQEKIDSLNLRGILEEQISLGADLNLNITGFVLRRLSQINDLDGLEIVLGNIGILYPVFKEVLAYFTAIRKVDAEYRQKVGKFLLSLIEDSVVGHLEYHKCWIINTFTKDREWDNQDEFVTIYNNNNDEFSHRESVLAIGRAGQDHWFKARKRTVFQFGPWEKRAFLAAASCLPKEEAHYWYSSIYGQLDILEKSIVDWAKANPFA